MKVLAGYVREGDGALGFLFQGERGGRGARGSRARQELCPEGFWGRHWQLAGSLHQGEFLLNLLALASVPLFVVHVPLVLVE